MKKEEWLRKVANSKEVLRNLIGGFHPGVELQIQPDIELPVTAAGPEAACERVREKIRSETRRDPVEAFDKALEAGDTSTISSLLSSTWFGIPESTSCWSLPGFSILVDLLDDPVEPEDSEVIQNES